VRQLTAARPPAARGLNVCARWCRRKELKERWVLRNLFDKQNRERAAILIQVSPCPS
jgi:hypothetical protein